MPTPAIANSNITGAQSSGSVAAATGLAATFPNATTSGNSIRVGVVCNSSGITGVTLSVTDNHGNTYTEDKTLTDTGTGNTRASVFRADNITPGATHTVTAKATATAFISLGIAEVTNLQTHAPDATNANSNSASTTAVTTNSITVNAANDFLIGVFSHEGSASQSITNGSGWVTVYNNTNTANSPIGCSYQVLSASTADTWTLGANATGNVASGASYLATTSGAAVQQMLTLMGVGS